MNNSRVIEGLAFGALAFLIVGAGLRLFPPALKPDPEIIVIGPTAYPECQIKVRADILLSLAREPGQALLTAMLMSASACRAEFDSGYNPDHSKAETCDAGGRCS